MLHCRMIEDRARFTISRPRLQQRPVHRKNGLEAVEVGSRSGASGARDCNRAVGTAFSFSRSSSGKPLTSFLFSGFFALADSPEEMSATKSSARAAVCSGGGDLAGKNRARRKVTLALSPPTT